MTLIIKGSFYIITFVLVCLYYWVTDKSDVIRITVEIEGELFPIVKDIVYKDRIFPFIVYDRTYSVNRENIKEFLQQIKKFQNIENNGINIEEGICFYVKENKLIQFVKPLHKGFFFYFPLKEDDTSRLTFTYEIGFACPLFHSEQSEAEGKQADIKLSLELFREQVIKKIEEKCGDYSVNELIETSPLIKEIDRLLALNLEFEV